MILSLLLAFFTLSGINLNEAAEEKIILCYYGTWATYRSGLGKFDVDHIDVNLCTHLVYSFVGIDNQGTVISLDPYLDLPDNWGRDYFGKFNALKQQNPKLKTILAVGGWNEGSAKYSIVAANPTLRKNFVTSALNMLRTHGFDGFDVDWEYPNRRDSVHGQADVENFTQLLKELREAFEPHNLLLTAAVAAVKHAASQSYNVSAISKYLDFVSIMAYDMYGDWDPVTGHNAPLHKGQGDEDPPEELNTVDYALKYWLDEGCPPEKLVLGLPLYGRTFTLSDPNVHGLRAPSSGAGIAGPYTATNGYIGYNELCTKFQTESWDIYFDELARAPYAVKERDWVTFDSAESLVEKAEYGFKFDIAGIMVWSIETDDFHGNCHGESFPLLKALNRAVGNSVDSSSTSTLSTSAPDFTTPSSTSSSASTTAEEQTTSSPIDEVTPSTSICQQNGFVGDPDDCTVYYVCVSLGNGQFQTFKFQCPSNLYWDQRITTCNFPDSVKCDI